MTTTETERETTTAIDWPQCPICGYKPLLPFGLDCAHNTCSQACARTAAIVEAIDGWKLAAMPTCTIREQPWIPPTEPQGIST